MTHTFASLTALDNKALDAILAQGTPPAIADVVVDRRFRVHGFDYLYVCDASVFPTSVRIKPQMTVMAMADYIATI